MSYRTYVNNVQLFGNNEYYEAWLDFIRSQGITVGEESQYEGDITDFTGAMRVCEQIVMDIEQERMERRMELAKATKTDPDKLLEFLNKRAPSLFDLSDIKRQLEEDKANPKPTFQFSLFDHLYDLTSNGFLFIPVLLYQVCKDDVRICYAKFKEHPDRQRSFEILPGHKIHVKAG